MTTSAKNPVRYTAVTPTCSTCGTSMVLRGRAGFFRCLQDGRHPVVLIEDHDEDVKELLHGERH